MTQNTHQFHVKVGEEGRIDKFLSNRLPDISRSRIQRFITAGNVSLDGFVIKKTSSQVAPGNQIEIVINDQMSEGLIPEPIPLDILYEDPSVIVINKTADMLVHPGAGHVSSTLLNGLLAYHPAIRHVGEVDRPGVVHRLDKDTSGVVIFAKTPKAYHWLVKQFKSRAVKKVYIALVDGHPPTPTGRIEAPITRDHQVRTRMAVGLQGQGKQATSEFFELERYRHHSLLEIHPKTGRTHQIRVHLSYIGVPVVGDTLYGRSHPSIEIDRFFLHARSLSLKLPGDRAPKIFEAPLPEELSKILNNLRKNERFME